MILAAGLGTRMRSRTPKVLHPVAGVPMLDHVLGAVEAAGIKRVVVVVNPTQPEVARHVGGRAEVVEQAEQKGSGHALAQAPADVLGQSEVLVVNGDSPLWRSETLAEVAAAHRQAGAAATVVAVDAPGRRDGRIVRDAAGGLERIVEERDATAEQKRITEINAGLYVFRGGSDLMQALVGLRPANAQGELYLTDLFETLRPAQVVKVADPSEAAGINDRVELAAADRVLRARVAEDLMRSGVTILDPGSTYIDAGVRVGQDTVIEPFTFLRSGTVIGKECRIGPGADIGDSAIADGCRVEHSWLRGARMAEGSDCGPFSKLRPGTEIGIRTHVGTFAEIVRSKVGAGSAVPHFSYLGDAVVGEHVNIGAGTITANYDGSKKNPTEIGDGCFVGVDTMFVAPRKMGRGSKTGAGSVVNRDIPDGVLAVGMPARVVRRLASTEGEDS